MLTMSTIITGVSSSMPQVIILYIPNTIVYILCNRDTEYLMIFLLIFGSGVIRESGGHLPVDQLPVCLPVCD